MPPFDPFRFRIAALALLASAAPVALFVPPAQAQIAVGVSIGVPIAPPALPVYVQPAIPSPGYIWTPGYWAWSGAGYYWVPGTWVLPPRVGVLWTPGYWGWSHGVYAFNAGYWGPTVGFYGGINYGFGYGGAGFSGGYWNNGAFSYNTAVTNVGATHIGNTYNAPVTINRTNITNVSYNGGQGGLAAAPTAAEKAAASQPHVAPTTAQIQHQQVASKDPALSYANNKGAPAVAATARPGDFKGAVTRASASTGAAEKVTPAAEHVKANGQVPGSQGEHNPVHTAAHPEQRAVGHPAGSGPQGVHNAHVAERAVGNPEPHPGPQLAGPHPGMQPGPHAGPQFGGPHPGPQFGGPHPGPQFAGPRGARPGPRPGPHPGPHHP